MAKIMFLRLKRIASNHLFIRIPLYQIIKATTLQLMQASAKLNTGAKKTPPPSRGTQSGQVKSGK
jgi:hypothetical protein